MTVTTIACRSCRGRILDPILSLGRTPLANALLTEAELEKPEPTYPLELVFCPQCTLVQITETVPPETLFREYVYRSSFSSTMLNQAERLASKVIESRRLGPGSLVVEIASNDGYLLKNYLRAGVPVLGIEPAENIARIAREEAGVETISEFFGIDLARQLRTDGVNADVIHANNVLAHVPDLNGFVSGIRELLAESGVAIIEVPYLRDLIDNVEFDTIYHEHLCYFSFSALALLFGRHAMAIERVQRLATHGGSLRLYVIHASPNRSLDGGAVALLKEEEEWGVTRRAFYSDFGSRVEGVRDALICALRDIKAAGKRIAAYGASAKGSTMLSYFGIGSDLIDYVVDQSTLKQGYYTPGCHLRIYPPSRLYEDRPDYLLLLAWNLAEEILGQQNEFVARGGKIIIPLPKLRFIEASDR